MPEAVHPRDQIAQTLARIYRYRMTTTSGGNLSIRAGDGKVWITPARIDKGSLRPEDMACISPDGRSVGPYPPSSESPFHFAIYQARPDVGAVLHAHSGGLVAFAMAQQAPNPAIAPQAARVCGKVGYTKYALTGGRELAEHLAGAFAAGHDCVMMENHGAVFAGKTMDEAFQRFETLEFTARTLLQTAGLGEVRYLTDEELAAADAGCHGQRSEVRGAQSAVAGDQAPSATADSAEDRSAGRGTPGDLPTREQLAAFVRRSYGQRLFSSAAGSLSVRVGGNAFLITPAGVARWAVAADDLVLVREGTWEPGRHPSRAVRMHQAIYARHPEVGAIANAAPIHATAFSITGTPLETQAHSESFVLLNEVGLIPFAEQLGDGAAVAARVSPRRPAALLENGGALVVGRNLLEAFDRLEVLEATAEAVLQCRRYGAVRKISPEGIAELRDAFLR